MSKISNIEISISYSYQFMAAAIIRYYQIMPTIITKLYFIFIPLVCIYFFQWILDIPKYNRFEMADSLYQNIYIYIYLHVATNELEFKATSYEITTFTQGMKASIYWLVGFLFNITIITIPSIIYIAWFIVTNPSED
jgi:hypothetical protein